MESLNFVLFRDLFELYILRYQGKILSGNSGIAKTSVLVAVMNPEYRELIEKCLGPDEYKVLSAQDGWDITDAIDNKVFNIVVLSSDILDGALISVTSSIRNSEKNKDTIIILVQEHGEFEKLAPEDKSIINHVISAPFSVGTFVEIISQIRSEEAEKGWKKLNTNQQKLLRVTKNMFGKHFAPGGDSEPITKEVMKESGSVIAEATKNGEVWDILDALKAHDNYTFVHALKVSSFMTLFGVMLGLSKSDLETLAQAGLYHDIGKRDTDVDVLNFPGKLEGDKWDAMQAHAMRSEEILRESMDLPIEIINVAGRHHEKMDGTGYPRGLKGSEIDDLSAIGAIADVYSGLTDRRSYKPAFSTEKTLSIMESMSGTHLEAGFLSHFVKMIRDKNPG